MGDNRRSIEIVGLARIERKYFTDDPAKALDLFRLRNPDAEIVEVDGKPYEERGDDNEQDG